MAPWHAPTRRSSPGDAPWTEGVGRPGAHSQATGLRVGRAAAAAAAERDIQVNPANQVERLMCQPPHRNRFGLTREIRGNSKVPHQTPEPPRMRDEATGRCPSTPRKSPVDLHGEGDHGEVGFPWARSDAEEAKGGGVGGSAAQVVPSTISLPHPPDTPVTKSCSAKTVLVEGGGGGTIGPTAGARPARCDRHQLGKRRQ